MFSSYCQVNLELRTPYNSLVIPTIPTIPKKKSENKYSYRAYNALAVVYTYIQLHTARCELYSVQLQRCIGWYLVIPKLLYIGKLWNLEYLSCFSKKIMSKTILEYLYFLVNFERKNIAFLEGNEFQNGFWNNDSNNKYYTLKSVITRGDICC